MDCRLCVVIALVYNFFVTNILADTRNSFITKSINLTTLIGETVEFNCSENNVEAHKPNTKLLWLKNEKSLMNIFRYYSGTMSLNGNTLRITNVRNEDEGTYKCNTFNQSHSYYSIYTLTVNGLPKPKVYYQYKSNITINIEESKPFGHSAYILCTSYMFDDEQNYNDRNYTYLKNGKTIFFNRRMWDVENSYLIITDISYADKGIYECVTSNKFRIDHAVTHLNVVVQNDEYEEIENITKNLSELVEVNCPSGSWFKNDKAFKSSKINTYNILFENNSKVDIKNLIFEDAGIYTCNYSSYESPRIRKSYLILKVIDRPEKLSFRLFTSNMSLSIGETFQLKCHIFQSTSNYKTWFSWKKNGKQIVLNNTIKNIYFRNKNSILELSNLTQNEIGTYECEAESFYHKVYSVYTLTFASEMKNIKKVNSNFGYFTFKKAFILIGTAIMCFILWLRRKQVWMKLIRS